MHHLYLLLCNQTSRVVAASIVTLKMIDTKLRNNKISAITNKTRDDSALATYLRRVELQPLPKIAMKPVSTKADSHITRNTKRSNSH